MNSRLKKYAILGMLTALAYLVMTVGRIPIILFLKYDPKDIVIAIGGFIFGPLSAFVLSAVVSVVEMFTVSDTGVIGLIMNVISSCAFACTAAFIYTRRKTLKFAVIGLLSGCVLMTATMLLWNYLITPLYLGYPREVVAKMLIPYFLPFNLLKSIINASLTMLLYKPLVEYLRRHDFLAPSTASAADKPAKKITTGVALVSLFVLVTCILLILAWQGKI